MRSVGSIRRSSVHPSIRLSHYSLAAPASLLLSAVPAGDISRQRRAPSISGGATARRSAANASSVTLTADVGSWTLFVDACIAQQLSHASVRPVRYRSPSVQYDAMQSSAPHPVDVLATYLGDMCAGWPACMSIHSPVHSHLPARPTRESEAASRLAWLTCIPAFFLLAAGMPNAK